MVGAHKKRNRHPKYKTSSKVKKEMTEMASLGGKFKKETPQQDITRPPGRNFVEGEAGDERFLYDTGRDEVHVLNPTAQLVYDLFRQGRNREEIAEAVCSRFNSPEGQDVLRDVSQCIEILKSKGILPQTA